MSPTIPPLDETLYMIDDHDLRFMKEQTSIQDAQELRKHILTVQAEAYVVHPYPCIRRFSFIQLKLARLPAYQQLLSLGKGREGVIFLDIGCCFGNDIRKAIADGFPPEGVIGSDLRPDYWALGHKLFKSTPQTFPVQFLPGDVFDPAHLETVPPFYARSETPAPQLSTLTSLNPLHGHVSVIHASAFFHLFGEEKQLQLARALAGLLSPEPGSMVLGSHRGWPEKGMDLRSDHTGLYNHSPESWAELWDGQVFKKGTVKVDAFLQEVQRKDLVGIVSPEPIKHYLLVWSITRL